MSRRRGRIAAVLLLVLPAIANAQQGIVTQGARELLLPIGARSIGMGQAVIAEEQGADALWWNPASFARARRVEAGLSHVQTVGYRADLASVVYPVSPVGVVSLGINYIDLGTSPAADEGGELGNLHSFAVVYLASFGTTLGARATAGITYKIFQSRYASSGSTTAVDFGAQYRLPIRDTVTFAMAVRHLGLRLQVKDEAQADPLPTVYEAGASYGMRIPVADTTVRVRLSGSVIDRLESEGPGFRVGGEVGWRNTYFARAGYVIHAPTGSAPSLGLGASTGRLGIDIARVFGDFSSGLGEPPTYLTLRVAF